MIKREALEVLSWFSKILDSDLNFEKSLKALIDRIANFTDEKRCCIYLLSSVFSQEINGECIVQLCVGFPESGHGIGYCHSLKAEPIMERIFSEKKYYLVSDIEKDFLLDQKTKDWVRGFGIKSILFCPIISKEENLGIFVFDSQSIISEEEIEIMIYLADISALIIQDAVNRENLKAVNQKLQDRDKTLAKAVRLATIGEEFAKIAHEIRNPISVIGGFARRIKNKLEFSNVSESVLIKIKESAQIMVEEIVRLEEMINSLLKFTKGEIYPELTPINIFLEQIVEIFRKKNGVNIETDFCEETSSVMIDRPSFKRAIVNIIMNAREAVMVQQEKKINIKTYSNDHHVVVEVSNQGQKIPEHILDNIFEPFFTTKHKGTGLGLSIVYDILCLHDATIEVESTDKKTSFIIKLPKLS